MTYLLMAVLWAAPLPQKKAAHRHAAKKTTHHAARKPEGISPQRAAEIQKALVGAGYLSKVSGKWDAGSAAAMKKYQADHHWQTRFVPDARALFALGLVKPSASTQVASSGGDGGGGG